MTFFFLGEGVFLSQRCHLSFFLGEMECYFLNSFIKTSLSCCSLSTPPSFQALEHTWRLLLMASFLSLLKWSTSFGKGTDLQNRRGWIIKKNWGRSRNSTVVRGLPSHQCIPGSIPRPNVIIFMWVEFVVGSCPCFEVFSPGSLVFLPPEKPTFLNASLA